MFSFADKETACGMFTAPHIISLCICIALVFVFVILAKRLSDEKIKVITKIMAITFAVLEIIKIIFKFISGEGGYIDHWFPLFFCSLFIYALFMCGFGKGMIYDIGCSFIMTGGIVGGLAFLIVPATSLMDYPIYHFMSIHSMLFHSSMLFLGLTYLNRRYLTLNLKNYALYAIGVGAPLALALVLNPVIDANLMIVSAPINMPIQFINDIYEAAPVVYSIGVSLVYLALPYFLVMGVIKIYDKTKKKNPVSKKDNGEEV